MKDERGEDWKGPVFDEKGHFGGIERRDRRSMSVVKRNYWDFIVLVWSQEFEDSESAIEKLDCDFIS
jgi:hypothetical protein